MNPANLEGMAVVSLTEADRLGRVMEVLFQTQPLRAAALRVATDNGERVVRLDRVHNVGSDAVTVESGDVVDRRANAVGGSELVSVEDLVKLKVVDQDGSLLGHVTSLEMDSHTWNVESVDVRKGDVLGIGGELSTVKVERILNVGPELMTVRSARGDDVAQTPR